MKSIRITATCEQCGTEFSERPSRIKLRKFCSYKCSVEAKKKRIYNKCPICGQEYYATPSEIRDGKGKYCSHKCWAKNRTLKGTVERICVHCGNGFTDHLYNVENGKSKYCSRECQNKAIGESLKKRTLKVCPVCNTEFEVRTSIVQAGYGIHCSRACMRIGMSGEKASNWQGGKSFERYCAKFNEEFKERVREFFGRKCLLCGKKESDNKRRHSVHHVTGNKQICCDENTPLFVILCASCHNKVHRNMDMFTAKFIETIEKKYNGKCYYGKKEYAKITQAGSLNAQSSISSFQ